MRNQGAMLGDPAVREGYVQGSLARGMEAAGSNANGSMAGFMGMGVGMSASGGFMGAASAANAKQMERQDTEQIKSNEWKCECGAVNTGKFCSECGKAKPADVTWKCECGVLNTGKFCSECGKRRPGKIICDNCGYEWNKTENIPKFCPECGDPINEQDYK